MAALTADRNTPMKATLGRMVEYKLKASTTIYQGAMVAVEDSTGLAVPAGDTAGHKVVGFAMAKAVSGASDTVYVKVQRGTGKVNNHGSNPAVQATVGDDVHVADDNTIRISGSSNNIVAGKVDQLDSDGVWINIA